MILAIFARRLVHLSASTKFCTFNLSSTIHTTQAHDIELATDDILPPSFRPLENTSHSTMAPCASSLSTNTSNPNPYSSVSVLHLTWSGDTDAVSNAANLEEVWKGYGYEVTSVDERDLGLKGNMTAKHMNRKTKKWFRIWLSSVDAYKVDRKKLIVVCYFGHGSVEDAGTAHVFDFLTAIK